MLGIGTSVPKENNSPQPFLRMADLAKSFGETQVLHDFSVELEEGEVLALLGLSGSGKTTALRLLAGFEAPDRGTIHVGGTEVTEISPERRGFGMVFQHYALFPHMTVAENVAFGLEARGWDTSRIAPRIDEMLALVHLQGYGERRVSAISGGQQQRVALARALAPEPRLLLLDEPLSNLDPALREKTREELRAAVKRIGITTVLVTHEQEEAFHVGDRIAVLHHGRLHQVGSAVDLYQRPATPFVASFIGRSTTIVGRLESLDSGRGQVRVGGTDGQMWSGRFGDEESPPSAGSDVSLVVRPEALETAEPGAEGLQGVIREMRFVGVVTYALVEVAGLEEPIQVLVDGPADRTGEKVCVRPRSHGPLPCIFTAAEDS